MTELPHFDLTIQVEEENEELGIMPGKPQDGVYLHNEKTPEWWRANWQDYHERKLGFENLQISLWMCQRELLNEHNQLKKLYVVIMAISVVMEYPEVQGDKVIQEELAYALKSLQKEFQELVATR